MVRQVELAEPPVPEDALTFGAGAHVEHGHRVEVAPAGEDGAGREGQAVVVGDVAAQDGDGVRVQGVLLPVEDAVRTAAGGGE